MKTALMICGIIFIVVTMALVLSAIAKAIKVERKLNLGTLYFKDWPDGSRTFRIALDRDLDDLKEGDNYVLTVKNEVLTEEEKRAVKEILED